MKKCIIVDDEPIARMGIAKLVAEIPDLNLVGTFENAMLASDFMNETKVDLAFLDIQMPGVNGIEFAKTISPTTLVIFTTAFAEFALESYEVDAVDYLVKPINPERFFKAVEKALSYHKLLIGAINENQVEKVEPEYMFIKSERRFFKVNYNELLFIEGLKDYVIIQTNNRRLITHMNIKTIHELLPPSIFLRVNRSFVINRNHVDSFSNNDIYIGDYEIPIGNSYRDEFFSKMM